MIATLILLATLPAASDTKLLAAIRQVESGGNDRAVGDGGKARGAYQIWEPYWRDGCERGRVDWDYKSGSFDRAKSRQVVRWYWARYAPKGASNEVKARIHNGGPRGHIKGKSKASRRRYRNTTAYWAKVRKELKR